MNQKINKVKLKESKGLFYFALAQNIKLIQGVVWLSFFMGLRELYEKVQNFK